jgi:imidazolonepropionase-like amidohydrolase
MNGRPAPSAGRLPILFLAALLLACGGAPERSFEVKRPDWVSERIVIRNVAVLDTETLETRRSLDVVVEGQTIAAVVPTGGNALLPGALVIPGEGATLVPGLIDMHGHVSPATGPTWIRSPADVEGNLQAFVYAGVTTVFDPSDATGDTFERRDRVARGELVGPRIFTTGKAMTCDHGHPRALVEELAPGWIAWYFVPRVATAVDDLEAAAREVDTLAAAGADAVKIVVDRIPLAAPRMTDEVARAIVERASSHGLRTVAHIGTTQDAIDAADAGVSLWLHGVYKERIPDDQVAVLAGYGIPMVTTSEVFDRYGRAAAGPMAATKLERETVPQAVRDSFFPIPADFDVGSLRGWLELMGETSSVRLDNVGRMHAAGVTILAGSDVQSGVFPGASLHRELATLVAAGLSPAEAIRAATLDPARFLANGAEPDAGVVAVGKRADLLLVNGDPARDITALADIREVLLHGVPMQRNAFE